MSANRRERGLRDWPAGGGLYVLVTRSLSVLPFVQTLEASLRGGASALQLREKEIDDAEFVELGRIARDWTRRFGSALVINDRPEVALACEADGVHLGQEDRDLAEVRRDVGGRLLLGSSCHSVDDAVRAVDKGADYIGIGPIFGTRTKRIDFARGPELIREIHRRVALPSFPLGGIDLDRLDGVLEAGARGVAVCSAVLRSPRMEDTVREFVRRIEAARRRGSGEPDPPAATR